MTRDRMSRPCRSVPNGCCSDGASSDCPADFAVSIAVGEPKVCGTHRSAVMATAMMIRSQMMAMTASLLRRRRRIASPHSVRCFLALAPLSIGSAEAGRGLPDRVSCASSAMLFSTSRKSLAIGYFSSFGAPKRMRGSRNA